MIASGFGSGAAGPRLYVELVLCPKTGQSGENCVVQARVEPPPAAGRETGGGEWTGPPKPSRPWPPAASVMCRWRHHVMRVCLGPCRERGVGLRRSSASKRRKCSRLVTQGMISIYERDCRWCSHSNRRVSLSSWRGLLSFSASGCKAPQHMETAPRWDYVSGHARMGGLPLQSEVGRRPAAAL